MSESYKSVSLSRLQKAFARAHYWGYTDPDIPREQARQFREVARLIWDSCGEPHDMPADLTDAMTALGATR